jgi:hypothetical protein
MPSPAQAELGRGTPGGTEGHRGPGGSLLFSKFVVGHLFGRAGSILSFSELALQEDGGKIVR